MEAVVTPPPPPMAMPMEMYFHIDRYDTTIMEAPPVTLLMAVNWSDLNAHVNRMFPGSLSPAVRRIRLMSIVAQPSLAAVADRMPSVSLVHEPVTLFDNSGLSFEERKKFGIICKRQDASQPRTKLVLALAGHAAQSASFYGGGMQPLEVEHHVKDVHYRTLLSSQSDMFRKLPSRVFWHDRFAVSQSILDSENIDEVQSMMGVGWTSVSRGMRRISERNARIPIYDYAVAHNVGIIPMSDTAQRLRKSQKTAPVDQRLIKEHLFPHLVQHYRTQRATGSNPEDIQSPFALLTPNPGRALTYQWPLMQRVKAIVTDLFPSHRVYVDPDLLARSYEQVAAMEIKVRYPVWQTRLEIELEDVHNHVLPLAFETNFIEQSPVFMHTGDMASQHFIELYASQGTGIGRIRYSDEQDANKSGRGKSEAERLNIILGPDVHINELTHELVDTLDYDAFQRTIEMGLPPWYREAVNLHYLPIISCKFPPHVESFIAARIANESSMEATSLEMLFDADTVARANSPIEWFPNAGNNNSPTNNGNKGASAIGRKRRASQSPPDSPNDDLGASSDRPRFYGADNRLRTNKRRRFDEVMTPTKGSSISSVWESITKTPQPSVSDTNANSGFESEWDTGLSLRTSQVMDKALDTKRDNSNDSLGGFGNSNIDLHLSNSLPGFSDFMLNYDFDDPFINFSNPPLFDDIGGGSNGGDGGDDDEKGSGFGSAMMMNWSFAASSPDSTGRDHDNGGDGRDEDDRSGPSERERVPYLSPVSAAEFDEESVAYHAEQHCTFTAMVTLFATQAQWTVDEKGRLGIRGPYHYLIANASPAFYNVPWPLSAIEQLAHANADWADVTIEFLLAPSLHSPHKDWLRVRNVSAVGAMRAAYSPFSVSVGLPQNVRDIEGVFVNVRDNKTRHLFFPGRGVPILASTQQNMASTHLRLVLRICDAIERARITKMIPGSWNVLQPLWFGRRLPLFAWAVNADGTKVVFAQTQAVDMNSAAARSGIMIAGALAISANLVHAIQAALHVRKSPLVTVDDNYGSVALATADAPHAVFAAVEGPLVAEPPLVIFNPVPSEEQNRGRKIPSRF